MARKSTTVYTVDLLVHVEFKEGIPFKDMQYLLSLVKGEITGIGRADSIPIVTINKTIIQKKVTY